MTPELRRIMSLPRRRYEKSFVDELVCGLTEDLKTPQGTQRLKPTQAVGLYELALYKGLFGAQRVGSGKTLETLLAPTVLEDHRSLLLLPAALVAKTERERAEVYSPHWQVSRGLRIMSYEILGRTSAVDEETKESILDQWRPTLIIVDECQKLKNTKAAVTRRVGRYMNKHPDTIMIALSGTIIKHTLLDYGHLLAWCLKDGAPVPLNYPELSKWAEVLDAGDDWALGVDPKARTSVSALKVGNESVREAFRSRLVETPGVVASEGDRGCTASLLVRGVEFTPNDKTEENFKTLRHEWLTPDGWMLSEAMECWKVACELSLGLHYLWSPRPPDDWLEARRNWKKYARDTLLRSRTYDSEKQLCNAIDRGEVKDGGLLDKWRKIEPTFTPNVVCEWHDDTALDICAYWAKKEGPGIVWTVHNFFARELAKRTGMPYYGQDGVDQKTGLYIEKESGKKSIIASIRANGTGRNLQMFNRGLVTAFPPGADTVEQLIGRFHREGQTADNITIDVLLGSREAIKAIQDARGNAEMIQQTTGMDQLILMCDLDVDMHKARRGFRWQKQRGVGDV